MESFMRTHRRYLIERIVEPDHWTERGRATSVSNLDATGRPRRSVLAFGGFRHPGVIAMQKYGYEFEPVANRTGWFTARGVEHDAAEVSANRIHAEFELGSDLVFCGLPPDGGTDRLFLLESGDPAQVARDFGVGSQAECYDPEAVVKTPEMLRAIYRIIPFSPVLVNPAAYEARFTTRIDEIVAQQASRTIDEYGA